MNKFFIILFCFVALSSQGQMVEVKEKPSGYFGKRFAVGVHSTFGLSKDFQKSITGKPESIPLTINRDFDVSLYYTASSNLSIGVLMGKSNTSCNLDYYANDFRYGPINDVNGVVYMLHSINGSPNINDLIIGIDFKFFRTSKGALSPLGRYYSIGVIGHQYTIDLSPLSYNVNSYVTQKDLTLADASKPSVKVIPEISVGAGMVQPIFKVLIIDLGIKLGGLMTMKHSTIIDYNGIHSSLEKVIYNRLRYREILNLNIGLAYPF